MSDSEDEQLQYALKLSLHEEIQLGDQTNPTPVLDSPQRSQRLVVDLISDDDQTHSAKRRKVVDLSSFKAVPEESSGAPTNLSKSGGITGLDRAQMERDRLARINKQRISPPPLKRVAKADQASLTGESRDGQMPQTTLQYPKGVLKKTWAYGFPRDGHDIKIEEVLRRDKLNIAVLSSFQWDPEWIFSKLDVMKTKLVLIMQAKEKAEKDIARSQAAQLPNCRVFFPPMGGLVNCMHSKLQLLFYDDSLRVVIPSANLTSFDWGENGVLENAVFLIDLPRLPKPATKQSEHDLTFFGKELVRFLRAKGLSTDIIDGVCKFDFNATKEIAFVHTIGGVHTGDTWKNTGYCGLGTAVRDLNLQTNHSIEVDFVISSVGSLNLPYIKDIYNAVKGADPLPAYAARYAKASKKDSGTTTASSLEQLTEEEVKKCFRAYFPSSQTVKESVGGTNCGGTLFLSSAYWRKAEFPREIFRDCQSKRRGMLMHNKMLFARSPKPLGTRGSESSCKGWIYHGSANLSESAWGRLVKDPASKMPKLNCRNWECGVLLPIPEQQNQEITSKSTANDQETIPSTAMFGRVLEPPMIVPGQPLLDKNKTPWFLQEPSLW